MAGFDRPLPRRQRSDGARWPQLVRRRPPDGLALSATATQSLGPLCRTVAAVRAAAGPGFAVFVGGHVVARYPELAAELGVPCATSADDGVAIARRLLCP
jgi:hypothetical protein